MGCLRKGVLLMMAMLVALTAAPSWVCALPATQMDSPECCRGMAPDCAQMMSVDSSCCQLSPHNIAVNLVLPFSPEHSQHLFVGTGSIDVLLAFGNEIDLTGAATQPLPSPSPGRSSVLRI